MGLLTERGVPEWHPAPPNVAEACQRAAAYCRSQGIDIAQLAIQYALAYPGVATTLVGTANPENIERDVRWMETPIDEALLAEVLAILVPVHNTTWPSGRPENN